MTDLPPVERRLAAALLLLAVVSLILRGAMIGRMPFVIDELVDTQLAVQVGRGVRLYADHPWERTPLMTWLLSAWTDGDTSSFAAATMARQFFWLATVVVFAGVYAAGRRLLGRLEGAVAVALLCAFTTYLDRSVRVRSDGLSTAWALGALLLVTSSALSPAAAAGAGLCLGMAFLTTQKAIYFVVAFAVALSARVFVERQAHRRPLRRWVLLSGTSAAAFLLPLAVLFGAAALQDTLQPTLQQLFLRAGRTGLMANSFSYSWIFLALSVLRNPAFWLLGAIGAVALTAEARRPGPETGMRVALGAFTVTLVALILQHKVKFPYLYLTVAPALAVAGSMPATALIRRFSGRTRTPQDLLLGLIVFVPLLFISAQRHLHNLTSPITPMQRMVMDRIDALTEPDDAVLDGMGMAVTRRKATPWAVHQRWRDELDAGAGYDVTGMARAHGTVVWVEAGVVDLLPDPVREGLRALTIPHWGPLRVPGVVLAHPGGVSTHEIELLASKPYAVHAPPGVRVRVDDREVNQTLELHAGRHRVTAEGPPGKVSIGLARAETLPALPPLPAGARIFPTWTN